MYQSHTLMYHRLMLYSVYHSIRLICRCIQSIAIWIVSSIQNFHSQLTKQRSQRSYLADRVYWLSLNLFLFFCLFNRLCYQIVSLYQQILFKFEFADLMSGFVLLDSCLSMISYHFISIYNMNFALVVEQSHLNEL